MKREKGTWYYRTLELMHMPPPVAVQQVLKFPKRNVVLEQMKLDLKAS
jgi:hypothetical protein